MNGKTETPAVLRGAGETGKVYPAYAENLQSSEQLADSAASERGLHHFQTPAVRCAGATALLPENRRVSGQSGADLREIRAELLCKSAIREIGRNALAFMKEHPDDYERIYFNLFGKMPEKMKGKIR